MKREKYLLLGILVFVVPFSLMAISLFDYTVTETYFQEAYLNGNFNFNSGNQDQASYNGAGFATYKTQYSTLPLTWKLNSDASYSFLRGSNDGDTLRTGYQITLNTDADKYFGKNKIFAYGSLNFGSKKEIGNENADKPFSKIGIGGGYGRVYDATSLARTMMYIDDLKKYGIVTKSLSDEAYLNLAKIIAKEDEYKAKYGTIEYKKYWFEDMEKILSKEGVLKNDHLSALGVMRMEDVLNRNVNPRRHGWSIRSGIGYVFSNYDDSDSDPSLDVRFEYALPFKYYFQLIEQMDYSTVLGDNTTQLITNNLSVSYQLTDKINWENSWIATITIPSDKDAKNVFTNTFTSAYYYYIANHISLNTTLQLAKIDDGIDNNNNDEMTTTLSLGIQYRIK